VRMLLVLTAGVPACLSTLTHQNVHSIRRAKRRSDSDRISIKLRRECANLKCSQKVVSGAELSGRGASV
jgi:hypothetical protein